MLEICDLREYYKMETKMSDTPEIREEDIVMVEDENRKNRATWKLGRIESFR